MKKNTSEAAKDLEAQLKKLLEEHPIAVIVGGLLLFGALSRGRETPAHLKGLAPIHQRTAGPWRGKGSFGRCFGPQTKR